MSNTCFHCQLEVNNNNRVTQIINEKAQDFCCFGCASVCSTIYQSGLDSFYKHQSNNLLPKVKLEYDAKVYNSDTFQEVFLEKSTVKGQKSIILSSVTIHCAACIWLIERALYSLDGVFSVNVNLTNKRIRITWEEKLKLSEIMQKLSSLGYGATPYEANQQEELSKAQHRAILYRIIFASFTMMNLLWISISLYSGANDGEYQRFFNILSFALATPTIIYAGYPFLHNAYLGLKNFSINMDLPISIGALTTYFYSTYNLFFTNNELMYFDTVVNFIFIILIGRFFETQAKQLAISNSQTLQQLQPKVITVLINKKELIKPLLLVKIGDIVLIKPGERIGVDAKIISGKTQVNEALLTGEAKLVDKTKNDNVFSGTINDVGSIEVIVTTTPKQSRLSTIINLVDENSAKSSNLQCTIDRFIPYFVITTLSLALITFIFHYQTNFDLALLSAVSVLIITCPCAFGIAIPISMAVASSRAAQNNILIKDNVALEQFHKVEHIVFDKTGTLTTAKMSVDKIINISKNKDLFNIIASIESSSEHNIAKSIIKNKDWTKLDVIDFKAIIGSGVSGIIARKTYRVGSFKWCCENLEVNKDDLPKTTWEDEGKSTIWCASEKEILGLVILSDKLKEDTKQTIEKLQLLNKKITVLTGDGTNTTKAILKDIKNIDFVTNCSPKDKSDYIKKLQKKSLVAMVGDGFNDTPALAQADISIVIGSGADVAHNYAHCVLLSKNLNSILTLNDLSKKTQKTIYQNIYFSLFYNSLTVPLAMMAQITPLFAAILMPISSLVVIINAILLKRK